MSERNEVLQRILRDQPIFQLIRNATEETRNQDEAPISADKETASAMAEKRKL